MCCATLLMLSTYCPMPGYKIIRLRNNWDGSRLSWISCVSQADYGHECGIPPALPASQARGIALPFPASAQPEQGGGNVAI